MLPSRKVFESEEMPLLHSKFVTHDSAKTCGSIVWCVSIRFETCNENVVVNTPLECWACRDPFYIYSILDK